MLESRLLDGWYFMKILFVMNNAFTRGNGLAGSCRNTVKYLREAGEDVRILSAAGEDGEKPDYLLPDAQIPVFDGLVRKQGYSFAKRDRDIITEAVRWADVVHLEEPFDLEMLVCKIAQEENKPMTGTYHLHPENLFASVHLRKSRSLNCSTMILWRNTVFNHCKIVQCPTENVKERLIRYHYKPELRVISNGMLNEDSAPLEHREMEDGFYTIVATGRYSVEKKQKVLLKAMRYSKYADKIKLVFAGRGPTEAMLKKEADKLVKKGILKTPPVFCFCNADELKQIYAKASLYIHCAIIEVEGMSCMEAIQTGLVPVIAKGRYTATSQFALSPESIYKRCNARDLAKKIDYWLSDDERRKKEAARYLGMGKKYDIHKSIDELRKMFRDAVEN